MRRLALRVHGDIYEFRGDGKEEYVISSKANELIGRLEALRKESYSKLSEVLSRLSEEFLEYIDPLLHVVTCKKHGCLAILLNDLIDIIKDVSVGPYGLPTKSVILSNIELVLSRLEETMRDQVSNLVKRLNEVLGIADLINVKLGNLKVSISNLSSVIHVKLNLNVTDISESLIQLRTYISEDILKEGIRILESIVNTCKVGFKLYRPEERLKNKLNLSDVGESNFNIITRLLQYDEFLSNMLLELRRNINLLDDVLRKLRSAIKVLDSLPEDIRLSIGSYVNDTYGLTLNPRVVQQLINDLENKVKYYQSVYEKLKRGFNELIIKVREIRSIKESINVLLSKLSNYIRLLEVTRDYVSKLGITYYDINEFINELTKYVDEAKRKYRKEQYLLSDIERAISKKDLCIKLRTNEGILSKYLSLVNSVKSHTEELRHELQRKVKVADESIKEFIKTLERESDRLCRLALLIAGESVSKDCNELLSMIKSIGDVEALRPDHYEVTLSKIYNRLVRIREEVRARSEVIKGIIKNVLGDVVNTEEVNRLIIELIIRGEPISYSVLNSRFGIDLRRYLGLIERLYHEGIISDIMGEVKVARTT